MPSPCAAAATANAPRSNDGCEPPAGIGKSFSLPEDWAAKVISSVGNYGEIFARNLGVNTPLGLERGQNALWRDGGLLYAPPIQ